MKELGKIFRKSLMQRMSDFELSGGNLQVTSDSLVSVLAIKLKLSFSHLILHTYKNC